MFKGNFLFFRKSVHTGQYHSGLDIHYEIDAAEPIIKRYYDLLTNIYRKKIVNDFHISKDEDIYNRTYGHFITVRKGDQLIGGARVIYSTPTKRCLLPLESSSFTLASKLPELFLGEKRYAEWGRLIVDPVFAEKKIITENIARTCVNLAFKHDCNYLFGLPIIPMEARYTSIFNRMNLRFEQAIPIEETPTQIMYKKLKTFISVTDLHMVKKEYDLLPHALENQDKKDYSSNSR